MSRDPVRPPDERTGLPEEPPGRLGTTPPGLLVGTALVGLVLGWLVRPVGVALDGSAPAVGWLPALALVFVSLVVGAVAWSTHRLLHRHHGHLEPHHAVNRLVLAKACALVGSFVTGAYLGYALSWVGITASELTKQRVTHSLVAAAAGVLLLVGSLLLERACRIDRDDR